MKSQFTLLLATVAALGAAAPSFAAGEQLASNAGLSQTESAGLSLSDVAQAKFNRDARGDATPLVTAPEAASAEGLDQFACVTGLSADEAHGLTLGQIAALKFNRGKSGDDRQPVKGGASFNTRSIENTASRTQLVANAGLSSEEAAALSLTEIAQAKFDRDNTN
jgi:hypothetical protein